MGCSVAWELSRRAVPVLVLERSVPGAEASSRAAGILGAQIEASGPGEGFELARRSLALWPRWARALHRATGVDVCLRRHGTLRVLLDGEAAGTLRAAATWQRAEGYPVRWLDRKALAALEPGLSPLARGGAWFEEDMQLDPVPLLTALHLAARRSGAEFRTGAWVRRVVFESGVARGVALDDGSVLPASAVVVAAGSWTSLVEGGGVGPGEVRPARGQIVELRSPEPVLRRVVFGPRCYLVPRDDGRVLVGSTLEFVGFQREVTAAAVRELLDAALSMVPALERASWSSAWASFRPYTQDDRPRIGATRQPGLFLATGHHRNGILLAPITAVKVAAALGRWLLAGRRGGISRPRH